MANPKNHPIEKEKIFQTTSIEIGGVETDVDTLPPWNLTLSPKNCTGLED